MSKEKTKVCKHCKEEIDAKAKVCPHCRKKQGGKLKWVVIIIIVLAVLGMAMGGGDDDSSSTDSQTKSTTAAKKETAKKLGEPSGILINEENVNYWICYSFLRFSYLRLMKYSFKKLILPLDRVPGGFQKANPG